MAFARSFLLMAACLAAAHAQPTGAALVEEIRSHDGGIAVWWLGNAGWLIKSGGIIIATDPDLESAQKLQPPPLNAQDLAGLLDVAFVTHHHGDHCNEPTLRALARGGRTRFVLPRPCLKAVSGLRIPSSRVVVPQPLQPFDIRGIRVEPVHAIHGNQDFTVLTREPDFIESIAHNCGYVFNLGGKRILQPGDSVLTEEHLALKNIDVLFVSPTVHNMHLDRSQILINALEPGWIFPQHFDTYRSDEENAFWTRGYPDELKQRLSRTLQSRYHKLKQGEKFVIH